MADPNRQSPVPGLAAADPGGPLVAFAAPPAGMAALRGRLANPAFVQAAEAALGFAPPDATNRAHIAGDRTVFRLGPDHWLAVDEAEADFGRRLEDYPGLAALDMTSARMRLRLHGQAVRDLLAVGATIDLRARTFPQGAFAQTSVGAATAILHARGTDMVDAYIARSYAESWRRWLAQAGLEFDLHIAEE